MLVTLICAFYAVRSWQRYGRLRRQFPAHRARLSYYWLGQSGGVLLWVLALVLISFSDALPVWASICVVVCAASGTLVYAYFYDRISSVERRATQDSGRPDDAHAP
jgi:hypothetical protein